MMKNRFLVYLLALFIIWLYGASFLLFEYLHSQHKYQNTYEIHNVKIGSASIQVPILLNKNNGKTYTYVPSKIAWIPIDFKLKDTSYPNK